MARKLRQGDFVIKIINMHMQASETYEK